MKRRTDPRYSTARWQRTRLQVLSRDLWRCFVAQCPWPASVADHVHPVYPGMPDWEFYDLSNLRASCREHNLAKGTDDRMAAIVNGDAPSPARPQRYSYGVPRARR